MDLVFRGTMVRLVTPTAVELSVWIRVRGCGQPILLRVCQRGTISLAVVYRAPSSASVVEDMMSIMIWEIDRMGPLCLGKGSFSDMKM
jgi:hypothetical protein